MIILSVLLYAYIHRCLLFPFFLRYIRRFVHVHTFGRMLCVSMYSFTFGFLFSLTPWILSAALFWLMLPAVCRLPPSACCLPPAAWLTFFGFVVFKLLLLAAMPWYWWCWLLLSEHCKSSGIEFGICCCRWLSHSTVAAALSLARSVARALVHSFVRSFNRSFVRLLALPCCYCRQPASMLLLLFVW